MQSLDVWLVRCGQEGGQEGGLRQSQWKENLKTCLHFKTPNCVARTTRGAIIHFELPTKEIFGQHFLVEDIIDSK
jgi:hypothetical protein